MVFSSGIHTDHHRIVPHNGRELEITLALVSGVVDRDMALMAEMYNVVVHRPITGGSDNKERLCQFFQILRPKYMLSPDDSTSLISFSYFRLISVLYFSYLFLTIFILLYSSIYPY